MKFRFLLLLLLASFDANYSHAHASDPFEICDGLKRPGPNDDLLATDPERGQTVLWSQPRVGIFSFDEKGVSACDAALADSRLKPTYVQRRANLLQARAVHLLGSGRVEEALSSLGDSDRVGAGYPAKQFEEGIGLGNRVLRGIALQYAGRQDEADREFDLASRIRPWATSVAMQILRLRLPYVNVEQSLPMLKKAVVLNPSLNVAVMATAMQMGDFQTIIALGSGPAPEPLPDFQNYQDPNAADAKAQRILSNALRAGMRAYALCASARCSEGRTELDAFEASMRQSDATVNSQKDSAEVGLSTARGKSLASVVAWRKLIALRQEIAITPMPLDKLLAELQLTPGEAGIVRSDLLQLLAKFAGQTDRRALKSLFQASEAALATPHLTPGRSNLPAEFSSLPDVETSSIRVRYRPTTKGAFSLGSGFTILDTGKNDEFGVYFVDFNASMAAVEEAALYAAADLAKSKGFDAIVLTYSAAKNRRVVGSFVNEDMGRVAYLRFKFVSRTSAEPSVADYSFRMIDVDDVISGVGRNFRPLN
ncbi:MAG: hypothetical protein ABI673_02330 [Novosphingobium sp.]